MGKLFCSVWRDLQEREDWNGERRWRHQCFVPLNAQKQKAARALTSPPFRLKVSSNFHSGPLHLQHLKTKVSSKLASSDQRSIKNSSWVIFASQVCQWLSLNFSTLNEPPKEEPLVMAWLSCAKQADLPILSLGVKSIAGKKPFPDIQADEWARRHGRLVWQSW